MNRYHQLSFTSLVLASLFATGCSQQQIHETVEPTPEPGPVVIEPEPVPVVIQPEPVPAPVVVRPAPVVKPKPAPPRRRVNPNCHHHASNAMTKSIQHCHKNPQGKHRYGGSIRSVKPVIRRAPIVRKAPVKPRVDVRALQRKLKSKGYYRGPIDGVVGNGTRDALKRFQNR
jgi:hypothetical protein